MQSNPTPTTDSLRHVLCGQTFDTIERFNRHVRTLECPVIDGDVGAKIKAAGLDCGCQPGWRCVKHAKMLIKGRSYAPAELVVNAVCPRLNVTVDTDTGDTDFGSEEPAVGAGSGGPVRNAAPRRKRASKYGSAAERQAAYRNRKRGL